MLHNHKLFRRDLTTPLEVRDAIPRPASFNADARTVEAVIASATPVPRQDARGAYHEILDPAGLDVTASRGASVLDGHRQDGVRSILGTLDDVRVEGDEIVGLIRFSGREEVLPIVEDVRAGIISHLSVGYEVANWQDGERGGVRTRTATQWVIREASFVSIPADRNARTRALPIDNNRAAANQQIRVLGVRAGVGTDVINALIDRGATVAEAREEFLWEMAMRGTVNVRSEHNMRTLDNPDTFIRAAGEALYMRVMPNHQPSGPARQYVGLSIPELARECLRRSGENITGLAAPQLVTRALHSTSDFPLLLANAFNKTLRDSYTAAPSGLRQLARQTTAADFRTKHRLMLDSTGIALEKVNEHGEFKSGTMAEGDETYSVATYGKIFGITRQALVNDDLGAFADLSRRMGNAAAAFEAQNLVDLLVQGSGLGPLMRDGQRLFYSGHGNVAGTGAAIADTTLSAARLALRKQTGIGGGLIEVAPWAVLVPPDVETAAEKQLATISPTTTSDVNPWTTLRLIVEPRLTSTTRWYVVANPATIDGLEYAYLAGAPGPQVESQAGFRVDGIEIRIRLDFGCGFVDWRGWYSNAGA
jgi:hypothetical protein